MSKETWAFTQMVRYNLCVDFYANRITDTEDNEYYWQGVDIEQFYEVLQELVIYLETKEQE